MILEIIIASSFVVYVFSIYLFSTRTMGDTTKILGFHILTLIYFTGMYIFTILYDDSLWEHSYETDSKIDKILIAINFGIFQHSGFGVSELNTKSMVSRVINSMHSIIAFLLTLSILFEMLEKTELDGFQIWRSLKDIFSKRIKIFVNSTTNFTKSVSKALTPPTNNSRSTTRSFTFEDLSPVPTPIKIPKTIGK